MNLLLFPWLFQNYPGGLSSSASRRTSLFLSLSLHFIPSICVHNYISFSFHFLYMYFCKREKETVRKTARERSAREVGGETQQDHRFIVNLVYLYRLRYIRTFSSWSWSTSANNAILLSWRSAVSVHLTDLGRYMRNTITFMTFVLVLLNR